MHSGRLFAFVLVCFSAALGFATVFGTVRGISHDPHHRPIQGVKVILRAQTSDWTQSVETDADGEFKFMAVPVGEYIASVSHPGFAGAEQNISVHSGEAPVLHFALQLAGTTETVEVSAAPPLVKFQSSTTENTVDRRDIERLPGADRTNSLAMVTDLVPGASMIHDQLHIRGGHQMSWLVDGVPVPNNNIGTSIGPQFDPKDIDYLEVQRGGYSAEYGDRAFAVFNVVPRSGFERNNQAEVLLSYGNHRQTNDQFSLGGHNERFAYYASLSGNRSDLGLQTPSPEVVHDLASGLSGFTSLIYNPTSADQLRLAASGRGDHYQVPNTPDQQALGARAVQDERDLFVNFSWIHTLKSGVLMTVSPILHRNRATFEGAQGDGSVAARDDQTSLYRGGQAQLSIAYGKHNFRAGFSAVAENVTRSLGLAATEGSGLQLNQDQEVSGVQTTGFIEDQYTITPWLTLNGGARFTYFSGLLTETAASPRAGAVIRLPRLNWAVRGSYGRFYQPPPLSTVSGPLLDVALEQGFGFLPLRGERDEQYEVGLTIPVRGWTLDLVRYHTNAHNYFDHDVLGNSNVSFPVTIAGAKLRGWEATLRSAELFRRAHVNLAYARQYFEGFGEVTGGLTDFSPPEEGTYFLDHDQRDTLSGGLRIDLPWKIWASGNVSFGSGFLDGDGPAHLPSHTTADLSLGKSIGENLSLRFTVMNLTDNRFLVDRDNSLSGTHYNYPREIFATLRYRFHY